MGRPAVVVLLAAAIRRDGLRNAKEEETSPPPPAPPPPPAEEEEESGAGRFVPAILDFAVFVCLKYACMLHKKIQTRSNPRLACGENY